MAIDNSNVLQISVSAYMEGLCSPSDSYTKFFDMRQDDVA